LFPNETRVIHIKQYISSEKIAETCDAWSEVIKEQWRYFDLYMVGCAAYHIPFDGVQHQTGFSVEIKRRIPLGPGETGPGMFSIDETFVDADDMSVIDSVWGSPSID
jgi:hypothetical protein